LVTADLAEQVVACPACHLHLRMPSVAEASRGVAATRVAGLSGSGMPTMERGPSTFPSAANPYVSPVGGGGGPAGLAFQAHSEPILYILPGAIQLTLAVLGLFVSLGSLAFGLLEEGPPNNSDEVFTLLFQTVSLVTTGVIIAGSIQMIRRRSLGLARAAAILAILPCNVCCVMLMPFGIWSTVMLFLPNAPRDFQ